MSDKLRNILERYRELTGDVADVLSGGLHHDTMTYRGSLLNEAMNVADVLASHVREVDRAVKEERERCAGIAEAYSRPVLMDGMEVLRLRTSVANAIDIAAAIRNQEGHL